MNVGSVNQAAQQLAATASPSDAKKAQLTVALLKKTLDVQQTEAAQLLKMLEGKGQVVDLRV